MREVDEHAGAGMSEAAAGMIWLGLGVYAVAGVLVSVAVFLFGLRRFDPQAAGAPWRVKLLLLPGIAALWPVMIARMAGAAPAEDRGAEGGA